MHAHCRLYGVLRVCVLHRALQCNIRHFITTQDMTNELQQL